jgi:hypothetical protein
VLVEAGILDGVIQGTARSLVWEGRSTEKRSDETTFGLQAGEAAQAEKPKREIRMADNEGSSRASQAGDLKEADRLFGGEATEENAGKTLGRVVELYSVQNVHKTSSK